MQQNVDKLHNVLIMNKKLSTKPVYNIVDNITATVDNNKKQ